MSFALPRPSDFVRLVEQARSTLGHVTGLLPRVITLISQLERVMERVHDLMATTEEMERRAGEALERTEALVERADPLLVRFESTLKELEPVLRRITETVEPSQMDAVVRLIGKLPEMVDRLDRDVLPIVESLRTVPPDIHDLLDTSKDLNDIVGSVPGLKHVSRRADENERLRDDHWADNVDNTRKDDQ